MIKLHVKLEMPHPGTKSEQPDPVASVEEEVRHAIDMIESGHDSIVEWKLINKFAKELRGRKDKKAKHLLNMIDPILSKYGIHGEHAGNDEV